MSRGTIGTAATVGACVLAGLVPPAAGALGGKAFHTTGGIRCQLGSGTLLCRNPAGTTATMTDDGNARIGHRSKNLKAGKELRSGRWRGAGISCYPQKGGRALSCANGKGRGFFMDQRGAVRY